MRSDLVGEAERDGGRGKAIRMRFTGLLSALVALLIGMFASAASFAQIPSDATVLGRPRPDYSPIGVPLGGGGLFTVYPRITVATIYDDNVLREGHHPNADVAVSLQPEVRLQSDWDVHALGVGAMANIVRYRDQSRADYQDWSTDANGRLDLTDDLSATAAAAFAKQHEDRGSPDSAAADQDNIEFYRFARGTALDYKGPSISTRLSAEWDSYDYQDNNGINYDDRDYDFYETRLRVGTEVTPSISLFVEPGYNWRVYNGLDDFGFDKDSEGYDIHVGATYDVTAVTFLEVYGGYFQQNYEDSRFPTANGLALGLQTTWNPDDLTTVTANIGRTVHETNVQGAAGIVDTGIDLRVDYELLENLVASGHGSLHGEHFEGIGRDDNLHTLGGGLTYFINPYLQAGVDYTFGERNSHVDGEGYRYNEISLRLTGAL